MIGVNVRRKDFETQKEYNKAYLKQWRHENPEQTKKQLRDNYYRNISKYNTPKDMKYQRNWQLKKKYNITQEDYEILLEQQNFKCAICKEESDKKLHIDHDHKTGKVRGLLCSPCNTGLGLMKDSILLLQNAMIYLGENGNINQ